MTSINTTPGSTNPQFNGIVATLPMPNVPAGTNNAPTFTIAPAPQVTVAGGNAAAPAAPAAPAATATAPATATATTTAPPPPGDTVNGGGGTPANGAQPPAPGGITPNTNGATTPGGITPVNDSTPRTDVGDVEAKAAALSGFGKAERNKRMVAGAGAARFSFPSFTTSARSNTAPAITWGPGWTRVQKDGMWYMQHANGTKAVPAVEYRITPTPADQVQTVKVANGWGKRFPDGSVLVFDRNEGPYLLDAKGAKRKVGLGTQTIAGVKVRIFEASVVRTLEPNGAVRVFDSRGNAKLGSARAHGSAVLGSGGSDTTKDPTPTDKLKDTPPTDKGKDTAPPGKAPDSSSGSLVGNIDKLTAAARGILDQVRSGTVDATKLEELVSQLSGLPAGISAAVGGLGQLGGGALAGFSASVKTTSGGGGTPGAANAAAAPVAGVDANAAIRKLDKGRSAQINAADVPSQLAGKQVRFGQLAPELQEAIAKGFGSNQGGGAFKADQLLGIDASGKVSMAADGMLYRRSQQTVTGGGPGSDLALAIRPGRQPAGAVRSVPAVRGGGATTGADASSLARTSTRIELVRPGGEMRHERFGGINGSYTWQTLPQRAKDAILAHLASGSDAAARAFKSRSGSGWIIPPSTRIVVAAGYVQFTDGLSLVKLPTPPAPTTDAPPRPVTGGGRPPATPPGNTGHDDHAGHAH